MLTKKLLLPLIKRFRVLFFSMIGVSCLGIALMVGLGGGYQSFYAGYESYVADYGYPDAVVSTAVSMHSMEADLLEVSGVAAVNSRMSADLALKTGGRALTVRVFTFSPDDFQQFYVREEAEGSEYPPLYLEYRFSANNGIHAGDSVQLHTTDGYKTFFVSKIVSSPECIHMEQNVYAWGDNSDFGYAFLPAAHAETVFGREEFRNQYLLRFDAELPQDRTPQTVLEDCENVLSGQTVLSSFVYADSPVKKTIEINTEPLSVLSILLPALFFGLMLLVIVLFLSQIIRQCRHEIGVLRALGFCRGQVMGLFCGIIFTVTLLACALGIGLGAVVAHITGGLYANASCIPPFSITLPLRTCIIAAVITVLTGQLAAGISAVSILRIQPSEAMRAKAPVRAKVPPVLDRLLSRCRPMVKFTVFSALRNPGRFLVSTLCIAAAMTLILSALAFDYAKDAILTQLFDERIGYDCQVLLQNYPDEAVLEELLQTSGVTDAERVVFLPAELSFREQTESVLLNGMTRSDSLVRILDTEGQPQEVPQEGIILDSHLAERLGIQVGDQVLVADTPLTVTALSDHHVYRIQYVSQAQALALSDSCGGALFVNTTDEEALIDFVSALDGYGGATFTRLLRKTTEESFSRFSVGVFVILVFSFLLGLLIVFHTTKANITEQRQELVIIRILGTQRRQISRCWLGQSLAQYLLALLIGLPAGTAIARYVLAEMSTNLREYPFSGEPGQYLFTVLLVLAFVLVSHMLAMTEMRRWNLAEESKTHE